MDRTHLLAELRRALVIDIGTPPLPRGNLGLIVVDAVQGFTRRGALSDPTSMAPMVRAVDALVRDLDRRLGERLHLLLLRDRHDASIPEPPYPPHCIRGSGEELIDPDLAWLEDHARATVVDKDCINGFVGAMRAVPAADGTLLFRNLLVDWVRGRDLGALVLCGDCTDICVSDLAVALLSARNHGLLTATSPDDRDAYVRAISTQPIYVHVPACATFDLDPPGALAPLPESLRHPGAIAHHVGLWTAASRGALLVDGFTNDQP